MSIVLGNKHIIVPFSRLASVLLSVTSGDQAFSTSNCCGYTVMVLVILFGLFHCLTHVLACMPVSLVFSSAECLSVSWRRAFVTLYSSSVSWRRAFVNLYSSSVSWRHAFVTLYSLTNELIGIWGFVECTYNPLMGNTGGMPSHLLRCLLICCSSFSAVLVGVAK